MKIYKALEKERQLSMFQKCIWIGIPILSIPFLWIDCARIINRAMVFFSIKNGCFLQQYLLPKFLVPVAKLVGIFVFMECIWIFYKKVIKKYFWLPQKTHTCFYGFFVLFAIAGTTGFFCQKILPKPNFDSCRYHSIKKSGLWEGEFIHLGKKNKGKATALTVMMEKPEAIYLKGFTGSSYTGHGWQPISNQKIYQNRQTFWALSKKHFSSHTQLAQAYKAVKNTDATIMAIHPVKASRKYCYVPYGTVAYQGKATAYGDQNIYAKGVFGIKNYQVTFVPNAVKNYLDLSQNIYSTATKKYLSGEGIYNTYVYRMNLDIPKELERYFKEETGYQKKRERLSYEEANQRVMTFLMEHLVYAEQTKTYEGSEDFALDTLLNQKKGYDVHYATIATLLYRYLGIPCRYVEGYIITKDQITEDTTFQQIKIPIANAHAWVEIYQDGVGFVPMEVVPTYQNQLNRPTSTQLGIKNETVNATPKENQSQQIQYEKDPSNIEKNTKNKEHIQKCWLKIVIYCFLGIIVISLLFGFLFLVRHKTKQLDNRGQVLKWAKKMEKLWEKAGYPIHQPVAFWCKNMMLECKVFTLNDWELWFSVVEKAKYSSLPIEKEDVITAEKHFKRYQKHKSTWRLK
ncbi:MAG: transglutaminase domain-containing protein [Lachnospiraceae bacterium]|nr:transglutaminase domain-containing protein [Lachnospiraceae bacterium]